ncbi:sulfite exporter TauE/SafE family protein [Thalassotalea aquiviva]|uniref:sulfite exporter TauE/SafE family protein n=1 Tax=Thalassotalea aquiviva TaxID=3242415 RepID=UPI00352A223F
MELSYFSAFLIGLAGAGHCVAMCGGITSMLSANVVIKHEKPNINLILGYNAGRILSYSIAGLIAGVTGSLAIKSIGVHVNWLRVIAAIFLIFLALYIGQWSFLLTRVEAIGKKLWVKIQPLSKRFIPVSNVKQALMLGAIWGWLPCGLVYSTLTWSMASANGIDGMFIMMSFGLGTLPALFTLSQGYGFVSKTLKNNYFRKVTSIFLLLAGIYSLIIALDLIF